MRKVTSKKNPYDIGKVYLEERSNAKHYMNTFTNVFTQNTYKFGEKLHIPPPRNPYISNKERIAT